MVGVYLQEAEKQGIMNNGKRRQKGGYIWEMDGTGEEKTGGFQVTTIFTSFGCWLQEHICTLTHSRYKSLLYFN